MTKQKEKTNEKAAFHDFIKASGAKSFVFCQSQEEISDFLVVLVFEKHAALPPCVAKINQFADKGDVYKRQK